MNDKIDINSLKNRLRWYTYVASHDEYNEQEVNYIINYLKEHDNNNEEEIENSVVVVKIHNDNINHSDRKKTKNSKIRIIAIAAAITSASIIISLFTFNETIAGLKLKNLHFLERSDKGVTMIIYPDIETRYFSFEELPNNLRNIIWQPSNLKDYNLEYIDVKNGSSDYGTITVHFSNDDIYIDIVYTDNIINNYNTTFVSDLIYQGVTINYYINDDIHRKSFVYNNKTYYVASNDINIINNLIFDFVDFINLCQEHP